MKDTKNMKTAPKQTLSRTWSSLQVLHALHGERALGLEGFGVSARERIHHEGEKQEP